MMYICCPLLNVEPNEKWQPVVKVGGGTNALGFIGFLKLNNMRPMGPTVVAPALACYWRLYVSSLSVRSVALTPSNAVVVAALSLSRRLDTRLATTTVVNPLQLSARARSRFISCLHMPAILFVNRNLLLSYSLCQLALYVGLPVQ